MIDCYAVAVQPVTQPKAAFSKVPIPCQEFEVHNVNKIRYREDIQKRTFDLTSQPTPRLMTEGGTGVALPYLADARNTPVDYTTTGFKFESRLDFTMKIKAQCTKINLEHHFLHPIFSTTFTVKTVLHINSKEISRGSESRPQLKQQKKRTSWLKHLQS